MFRQFLGLLSTAALASAASVPNPLRISVPSTTPKNASDVIDHAYPGFGIAQHAFQDYAGNLSHPNTFSRNLIEAIVNRTGTAMHIRVGGTSGDVATYVPTQNTSIVLPPGAKPGGIPSGMKLGPAWFEGFSSFPGVQWTFMAHLALNTSGAEDNAVAEVREALKYIGSDLEALEVGNEIDLYPGKVRPANYNVQNYIHEWTNYTSIIDKEVLSKSQYAKNKTMYQAPVYATQRGQWNISNAFKQGIDKNSNIKSAALHHYMQSAKLPSITRQASLMNHTAIVSNLSIFSGPVHWLKENHPNIPLYLAETNSDTQSSNATELLGVFGSALWLVDYLLYGMTINIRRMNVQLSTGFDYTSWRPVAYFDAPPAVLPPYYAQVFVADVIGANNDVRVSNIDLGLDFMSAYAVFDDSSKKLAKIALVDLQEWNTTTAHPRPSTQVQLSTSVSGRWQVERLTAPGADSIENIRWVGTSWTYKSNGIPVQVSKATEYVLSKGGSLNVQIRASEALLLTPS